MWSSTSDNKKRENLEDCTCSGDSSSVNVGTLSSSSSASATVASGSHLKQQQQQQQREQDNILDNKTTLVANKNTFSESNSNLVVSGPHFGGNNLNKVEEKSTIGDLTAVEGQDSGFISGPQTHNIFESEIEEITDAQEDSARRLAQEKDYHYQAPTTKTKTVNKQYLNIIADEEESKTVFDSGCIEEEFDKEEEKEENKYAEEQEQNKEQEQKLAVEATSSTASYLASGSTIATTGTAASEEASQMILKHNVDAGMSEWFCNLSLQNTSTTQQQTPGQTGGGGAFINNLNEAGRQIAINAAAAAATQSVQENNSHQFRQQQQQQQAAAGNSAITNLTSSNAWEQFYQQNDDGDTPLHLACISGYVDVVAALIRMAPHPCLFNIQNDEAQTPLHLAVLTAQPKIMRMLLIAGAEPTIRDRHGNTALHLACIAGEEQCVRALTIPISASEINEAHRQYGHRSMDKSISYLSCARLPSDLEIRNYDGERCVHLAAQAGHIEVLRILVLYGADINAREGKSGRTPLHIAIECCNEDLANFLLDECLKLNIETATYAGLTAYQVACILNKSQMQNMLEKRGAEPLIPPDSDYDSDIESDLEDSKMYDRFGDPGYFINFSGGNFMTVA